MVQAPRLPPRLLLPIGVAILLAGAIVPFTLAAPGHPTAASGPASIGTPQSWARATSSSSNSTDQEYTSSTSTFSEDAYSMVTRATNSSATTVQLESWTNASQSERIVDCAPDCTSPTAVVYGNDSASSFDHVLENLTTQATVLQNGSHVAALGILSAAEWSGSSLAFSANSVGAAARSNGTPFVGTLTESGSTNGSISFGGAGLGLIPWLLPTPTNDSSCGPFNGSCAPPASWNDTVGYTASIRGSATTVATGAFLTEAGIEYGLGSGAFGIGFPGPSGLELAGSTLLCPAATNATSNDSGAPSLLGNFTCGVAGPGNETAMGIELSGYFGNGGTPLGEGGLPLGDAPPVPAVRPANGSSGSGGGAPPPVNFSSQLIVLIETTGPYSPSASFSSVVPGSDLFGGAVRDWPAIEGDAGVVYVGGVSPIGSGAPPGGCPSSECPPMGSGGSGAPGSGHGPTVVGPSQDAQGGAPPMSTVEQMLWMAAIGIGVATIVGSLLLRARRRPPSAAT